jgi:hypothetical protein
MRVNIHDPVSPAHAGILHYAATFYGQTLLPVKYKRITLDIYCRSNIGETEAETTWEDSNILPNEYVIRFSRKIKNMKRIVQTLAHEMVHVKQFAKGEMYDHINSYTIRWKRNTYNLKEMSYWDYPWEIDAYGRELGLYVKLKNKFQITDKELQYRVEDTYNKMLCSDVKVQPFEIVKEKE